jgi:type IV pilus assembly protein PilA
MRRRGFSLVEVMIVVAIIGVIAALATVGISGYLRHAKTAEATRSLGNMEIGSRTQFGKTTTLPDGTAVQRFCPSGPLTPASIPRAEKKKVDSAEWMGDTWKCLLFSLNDPQYYAYQYTTNGSYGTAARYTAVAYGDLDGDNTTSTFQLTGRGAQNGESEREAMTVTLEDE